MPRTGNEPRGVTHVRREVVCEVSSHGTGSDDEGAGNVIIDVHNHDRREGLTVGDGDPGWLGRHVLGLRSEELPRDRVSFLNSDGVQGSHYARIGHLTWRLDRMVANRRGELW